MKGFTVHMIRGKGNIFQLCHRHGNNNLAEMKNEHAMASIEMFLIILVGMVFLI